MSTVSGRYGLLIQIYETCFKIMEPDREGVLYSTWSSDIKVFWTEFHFDGNECKHYLLVGCLNLRSLICLHRYTFSIRPRLGRLGELNS